MRAAWILVVLGSSGCMTSCQGSFFQEGTCDPGGAIPALESLELGRDADPFVPFADGDAIQLQVGGQGSRMVVVRLRVRGPAAPACLPQHTEVRAPALGPEVRSVGDASLLTTLASDGSRVTGALLLPGAIPSEGAVLIETRAGGLDVSRTLAIGGVQLDFAAGDFAPGDLALRDATTD